MSSRLSRPSVSCRGQSPPRRFCPRPTSGGRALFVAGAGVLCALCSCWRCMGVTLRPLTGALPCHCIESGSRSGHTTRTRLQTCLSFGGTTSTQCTLGAMRRRGGSSVQPRPVSTPTRSRRRNGATIGARLAGVPRYVWLHYGQHEEYYTPHIVSKLDAIFPMSKCARCRSFPRSS